MDAACTIQDSIHVFSLVRKYVSRILGTYQIVGFFIGAFLDNSMGGAILFSMVAGFACVVHAIGDREE